MAIKSNAAEREAGKVSAKKVRNIKLTAEIGKVWLSMRMVDGRCEIELSTDCVDPFLNALLDNCGVDLEPERMFSNCLGDVTTEVDTQTFRAVIRCAKDCGVRFLR